MPHTGTEQDVGSVLAQFGGTEVPNSEIPTGSIEEVLTDFGATPVSRQPPPDTTEDILKQFGGTVVPPAAPPVEPVEETPEAAQQKDDPSGLRASKAALVKELEFIQNEIPESDPRRKRMEAGLVNKVVEQMTLERKEELGSRILLDGRPIKDDPAFRAAIPGLNSLEEIAIRFSGNIESTARRIAGDEEGALAVTQAVNDLAEYNQILAQDSIFGKKYGPLIHGIETSLGVSTLNAAATGGMAGVASLFALEEFNQGMKDGEELDPVDQWQTSSMRAGIMFATTLAGGLIANRAGVSSGDTVVPFFGKVASDLFTRTGGKNLALAGLIEFGEEGLQSLLGLVEQASSGTNPSATENLYEKVLTNASIGGFVGTVTQATSAAGKYDLPVKHFRDLIDGWGKRMKDNPEPTVKVVAPGTTSHGVDENGRPVSRETVEKELNALSELDQEIEAQFESGGAAELQQVIAEREADLAGTKAEIAGLNTELAGRGVSESQVRNRRNRRTVLESYRKELASRLAQDKATLKSWKEEFDTIHKQEREYIDSELERLSKQQELPNPAPPKPPEPPAEGEEGTKTPTEAPKAPETPPTEPQPSQFGQIEKAMTRARQKEVKRVRDFLELDKLPAREARSTEFDFQQAFDRGLPDKALELASDVLDQGRILDSIEIAGLQTRYVGLIDSIVEQSEFLQNNPDIKQEAFASRNDLIEDSLKELDTLTEAWIKSSSEAGAALQAQTRVLGILRSAQRAVFRARRNKGEALTTNEVAALNKLADDVTDASAKVEGKDPGTDAYNDADFELSLAMGEYDAAIANHKPSPFWLNAIEARNAIGMAATLTGDLTPLGRQAFFTMFTNPKQTLKNNATFFKVFANKSVRDAQKQSFLVNRTIQESENFRTLTKDFGVPIMKRHTPYTLVEGSGLSRLRDVLLRAPGLKKLADLPGAQFDIAYRAWLNQTRYTMADLAYRTNEHLLSQPGGKAEMQTIIDHVMHATGHTKHDFGKFGQIFLTAPRWMLSRMAMPLKALYHIPNGIVSALRGKPNASTFIAKQYAQAMIGTTLLSYGLEGIASAMFGAENVEVDRDITSPTFGFMTVNGRRLDITGGMGFSFRAGNKLVQGARETFLGPDNERDASISQTVGSTLTGRGSPFSRDISFAFNSGKPPGERDRMAFAEYVLRGSTPLTAQEAHDALKDEGIGTALFSTVMELFGFSGFEKR